MRIIRKNFLEFYLCRRALKLFLYFRRTILVDEVLLNFHNNQREMCIFGRHTNYHSVTLLIERVI